MRSTACSSLAASGRPVVVLIDDLHWAGRQTLALFRHLARAAASVPLLLLATFRDTVAEVPEPLAALLAELRRTDAARRISLSGLDPSSVEHFVATTVGHDLDRDLLDVSQDARRAQWRQRVLPRRDVAAPRVVGSGGARRWPVDGARPGCGCGAGERA